MAYPPLARSQGHRQQYAGIFRGILDLLAVDSNLIWEIWPKVTVKADVSKVP